MSPVVVVTRSRRLALLAAAGTLTTLAALASPAAAQPIVETDVAPAGAPADTGPGGAGEPGAGPVPTPTTPAPPAPEPPPGADATPPAAALAPRRGDLDAREREAMKATCAANQPGCDPLALLGTIERAAVVRTLAGRGLVVERQPHGKTIGRVIVDNQDVFGDGDGFLRWFNVFHRTTLDRVISREVLVGPGDAWNQARADETARNLRDPLWSALAVVVPVQGPAPGTVDLLVVTRDIWSLRLNTQYEFQESELTYLTMSIAEHNFLGRRALVAAVFEMDQGTYSLGPLYVDKNVAGRHLDLRLRGAALFNRETSTYEGSESKVQLSRPLWSLDTEWGAGVIWEHHAAIDRSFRGASLRTYDAPETEGDDQVPWEYRQRSWSLETAVVRSFGDTIEHQIRLGHDLASERPTPLPDLVDPVVRDAFVRDVLPRSERTSVVYLAYKLFTPRFETIRNIDTFDLAEDLQLGPQIEVSAGAGLELLGSDADFARLSLTTSWQDGFAGDGLWKLSGEASSRVQDGRAIDNELLAEARLVSPTVGPGRLVAEVRTAARLRETANRFYTLGGDDGLRGFPVGQFAGERKAVANVELRSRPIRILFTRWGAVAFWEAGDAADTVGDLTVHQDVGFGVRTLIPQAAPLVFRFDWAFALDGVAAGWPGRLTAGFQQAF